MLNIEIPVGTDCEYCDFKPADEERNLATVCEDNDGWIPPTFLCEDCVWDRQNSYEPPTESGGSSVVMNEYGRVF
jgi:hypothetical protein